MRAPSVLSGALTVFVAWNLLAAWFAVDQTQALVGERYQYQGLVAMVAYTVFLVGAWNTVRTDRRRTVLAVCVAATALLVAAYAVLQRAGLDPIWPTLPRDRVFSTIGQANALAAYLVVALPLAVPLCIGRRWPLRLIGSVTLALGVAAIAFTLSRGGYLGLASAAITLVAAAAVSGYGPQLTRRRLVGASLIVVAGAGIVMAVPTLRGGAERVVNRALLTADFTEGSTRMHLDQWAIAAAIVADHPVLGTGQDTYVLLVDAYRDDVLEPDRAAVLSQFRPESPHNVYLAIAAGAGVPALLAYLTVVAAASVRAIGALRSGIDRRTVIFIIACLAAVAGHLVTDMFQTAEASGSVLFAIILGAMTAASVEAVDETSSI